jgi:hypothetical protein
MFIALFSLIFPVDFEVAFNSFRVTIDDSFIAFFLIGTTESDAKGYRKSVLEEVSIISVLAFY